MLGALFLFLIVILLLLGAIFFFNPQKLGENKKATEETTDWEDQKEQSKKESEAERNKEWFSEKRWLTDQEIDWACERLSKSNKFKILPAHQFMITQEINRKDDPLVFPQLLSDLNGGEELVFIPVNNPDFHWSLLVYEIKSKKFWHHDTLRGANYEYVKSLVRELLQQIHQTNNPDLNQCLIKKHGTNQKNSWDCGVAVIAIIKRVREKYLGNLEINLGKFDFKKERQALRVEYLTKNE